MDAQQNTWWQKLGWLALIWLASVTTLACAAYAMRLFMRAAGMAL